MSPWKASKVSAVKRGIRGGDDGDDEGMNAQEEHRLYTPLQEFFSLAEFQEDPESDFEFFSTRRFIRTC